MHNVPHNFLLITRLAGIQGSGLDNLLTLIKQTVDSGRSPALAGLFRGQNKAFKEARTHEVIAQTMLQYRVSLERHTAIYFFMFLSGAAPAIFNLNSGNPSASSGKCFKTI